MNATREAYGKQQLTWVDRFGVYLSLRAVRKYFPRKKFSLLDIGCGFNASLLQNAEPLLTEGLGIDFEIDKDLSQKNNLTFIEANASDALQHCQLAFDRITCLSMLEHVFNPEIILKECYRLLHPKGKLLLNVPTWRGKFFLEFSAFKLGLSPKTEMDDHKMYYNKKDLWPLLVKAGFKPSNIKLTYHKFGLNLFAVITKE